LLSRFSAESAKKALFGEPVAHIGQPDESAAADLQGGQFTPGQYSINCSTAEPESLSQMSYADQGAFNVRLHLELPFISDLPFLPIRQRNNNRTWLCTPENALQDAPVIHNSSAISPHRREKFLVWCSSLLFGLRRIRLASHRRRVLEGVAVRCPQHSPTPSGGTQEVRTRFADPFDPMDP
jgi:hypothetical protein